MPWVTGANAAMLVDVYELTMAASYFAHGMNERATFELFVRRLPEERNFLIAAGLNDALEYLRNLAFDEAAIAFLRSLGYFEDAFLAFLGKLRFTGEAWAVPEGDVVFAGEPLIRLTAPLIEAQILETFLLNCISFQTMIASKAARIALACGKRPFIDFGARRTHGADAALRAARAAYIGGAAGTSNVLAGASFGIPLSGTMAHAYIMSFEEECDAFRAYARDFRGRTTLLIDTYDTFEGARRAVEVADELAAEGIRVQAVRLDSGDLGELAVGVRRILDEGGHPEIRILASGDLDEYRISELLAGGVPIDAFGVGTQLGTSADAPTLSAVYKLVEDEAGPKLKLSPGKATMPGRKQVYRITENGRYDHDVLALHDEPIARGQPLLHQVMAGGEPAQPPETLDTIRARSCEAVAKLPDRLRALTPAAMPYVVEPSPGLQRLIESARARVH